MLSRNEVVDLARAKCANPTVDAEWQASWNNVINHIEPLFKRKGIKTFEVHHTLQVAQQSVVLPWTIASARASTR